MKIDSENRMKMDLFLLRSSSSRFSSLASWVFSSPNKIMMEIRSQGYHFSYKGKVIARDLYFFHNLCLEVEDV